MKTCFPLLFFFFISIQIDAQSSKIDFYGISKIGNNNWNELNVGFGIFGEKARTWEFLFGFERSSGLLDSACFLIITPPHYFYTRTKLKGANLRVTYYPKFKNNIGFSLILRYGNAKDQFRTRCNDAPNDPIFFEEYDEEIFDIGMTVPLNIVSRKIIAFQVSPGFLIRTSNITNYVMTNDSGSTRTNEPRMTTRYKILLEWGFVFYLGRKHVPDVAVIDLPFILF